MVFDDASQDATYELAMGLKTLRISKLHVLKHARTWGMAAIKSRATGISSRRASTLSFCCMATGSMRRKSSRICIIPSSRAQADAVFGSRMMKDYGGPLKGGMPLYKYIGNRILTIFENRTLGMNLTEFHSGYRAYNLHALRKIDLRRMTDDFHFDTEIIIKLHHQHFRIRSADSDLLRQRNLLRQRPEVRQDVVKAVRRYKQTGVAGVASGISRSTSFTTRSRRAGIRATIRARDGGKHPGCAGCRLRRRPFLAAELKRGGNRVYGGRFAARWRGMQGVMEGLCSLARIWMRASDRLSGIDCRPCIRSGSAAGYSGAFAESRAVAGGLRSAAERGRGEM